MQPPPHSAIPAPVAIEASRSRNELPEPGGDQADPNTTADRSPRSAASVSCSSKRVVADREEHQVDRLVDVGEGRHGRGGPAPRRTAG